MVRVGQQHIPHRPVLLDEPEGGNLRAVDYLITSSEVLAQIVLPWHCFMHYICHTPFGGFMPRLKGETLSIRTSPDIKELLRLAAQREHRSVASMVEVLVLEYARKHDLQAGRMPKKSEEGTA
jgi:hypothetical protein